MAAFQRDPLSDFIERNQDPNNLWLFLHIPKTAGSSLSAEIARVMQPYRNIHVDYKNTDIPPRLQKQSVVDRFIADAQSLSFRSASGHIMMQHAQQVRTAISAHQVRNCTPGSRGSGHFRFSLPDNTRPSTVPAIYPPLSAYRRLHRASPSKK